MSEVGPCAWGVVQKPLGCATMAAVRSPARRVARCLLTNSLFGAEDEPAPGMLSGVAPKSEKERRFCFQEHKAQSEGFCFFETFSV